MQITDILAQMGGLKSMASELGVSETEAARDADATKLTFVRIAFPCAPIRLG